MTKVWVTEKIRLYPDKEQVRYFHKACSMSVHVYNKALEWDKDAYNTTGKSLSRSQLLAQLKDYAKYLEHQGTPHGLEYHTWREGIFRYVEARDRFFKSGIGFPKFQSNRYKLSKSFHVREDNLKLIDGKLFVPGMSRLEGTARRQRVRTSLPKDITILDFRKSRIVHDGKYWFLHTLVEAEVTPEEFYTEPIGVDFGIKSLVHTSDNTIIEPIFNEVKYVKLDTRKKNLQKKLSRQRRHNKRDNLPQPSNSYFKTLNKLRVVERHLKEFKKSYRIKVAKEVVKNNPSIVVLEDLNIKQMQQNKQLSPKIHIVGWYALRQQIEWEQIKKSAKTVFAPSNYPSTKRCSGCGTVKHRVPLSERTYTCLNPKCNLTLDRDLNAALNLVALVS